MKGNEVELAIRERGEFVGELALLDGEPRSATVVCLTSCRLFVLQRAAFMELLLNEEKPIMSYSFLTALVKRVRFASTRYFREELAQRALQAEMEAQRHRAMAQLVAGVAHELNTPLGIVNTAVDMIQKRLESEQLAAPCARTRKPGRSGRHERGGESGRPPY